VGGGEGGGGEREREERERKKITREPTLFVNILVKESVAIGGDRLGKEQETGDRKRETEAAA
jgi:hypothetical protein